MATSDHSATRRADAGPIRAATFDGRVHEVEVGSEPMGPARPDDERAYRRAITAWLSFEWASSAFSIVVVAIVLPLYFSSVAGATLPSPTRATQVFSLGTGIAVVVAVAVTAVAGVWADLVAARKRVLAGLVGLGAVATAALWSVTEGQWLLALVLVGLGRLAVATGDVLHDGLLPTVARPEDRGAISAGGRAAGSVGAAIVLGLAAALAWWLPADLGARWSFFLVAAWWAVFSVPLLRRVAEPPPVSPAWSPVRLRDVAAAMVGMVRSVAARPSSWRLLVAYTICAGAIDVVVALGALWGMELGLGTWQVLGALALAQVVGAPYTIMFGRLVTDGARGRGAVAAFLVANLVVLPVVGITLGLVAPAELVGRAGPDYEATGARVGQGPVRLAARGTESARPTQIEPRLLGADNPVPALSLDGELSIPYTGRDVQVSHAVEPGAGTLELLVDDEPAVGEDGAPVVADAGGDVRRFGAVVTARVPDAGPHELTVRSRGGPVTIVEVEILPPPRVMAWWAVAAALALAMLVAWIAAALVGRSITGWADTFDDRRGIILGLAGYVGVAVWGSRVDTLLEFWTLAWMVAIVHGGVLALFRSLYATSVPPNQGAGYFGLAASLIRAGSALAPLLFAGSVALSGSSRPAVLSLAVLFGLGIHLLRSVRIDASPPGTPGPGGLGQRGV